MISSTSDIQAEPLPADAPASLHAAAPARPAYSARSAVSVPVLVALPAYERQLFFPDGLKHLPFSTPLEWHEMPDDITPEAWHELLCTLKPTVILGGWRMPTITTEIAHHCPEIRYLCYVTGSVRKRVARTFIERGGLITNWGDAIAPSVAECGLMLTLMALRQATRYAIEMHVDRSWPRKEEPLPLGLFNKRVGLHGFGSVARALLPLLAPFGAKIEAYSAPVPESHFNAHGVTRAESLAALYRHNDIVIVAEALTPETTGSVDRSILLGMRPGSVFVNIARGAIVQESALNELATRGDVQMGLDVFAIEPLPADSPLRGRPNVTLLPHTAGPTIDWYPLCGQRAIRNLQAWLTGETPNDIVTLDRYDLST